MHFLALYLIYDLPCISERSVADLSGKTRVMELMTHPNSDVRYHALLSVQQLVSQPWVTV